MAVGVCLFGEIDTHLLVRERGGGGGGGRDREAPWNSNEKEINGRKEGRREEKEEE